MDWLNYVQFWHWWVLAGALLVLELASPVFFFLWVAFAAAAVGFLLLAFPSIPVGSQLVLFAILSLVAVIAWRRYRHSHPAAAGPPPEPSRDHSFTLRAPIADGAGTAQIDGSTWRLTGPDLPAGTRVRVVAVEGDSLTVEACDGG